MATLAFGALAAAAAALELAFGHTEGIDSGVFLLGFGLLMPAAIAVVVRGGPGLPPGALAGLAGLAALGLALALAATRLVDALAGDAVSSSALLLALLALWGAGVAACSTRARRGQPLLPGRRRAEALPPWLPLALVPAVIAVFASAALPEAGNLLLSLLLGAVLLLVHLVLRPAGVVGRRAAIALDLAAAALIVLLVSDVTVYTSPEQFSEPDPDLGGGTVATWMQLHHHSFLGPANDVIHGRTMLVDTYSLYGVGSIYFLAGLFKLVPIGYGTYGLMLSAGLALMYAVAYAILRLAGCSHGLCATAMAAAIVSSVFDTIGSATTFPSLGVQRWAYGYLLVLLAMLSLRREDWAPQLRIAMAAIVGISSIWSFEVFVYTAATFAGIAAYQVASARPRQGWLRSVAGLLAQAAVACLAAHLVLALGTLAMAGELPDWSPYLAFVREYSFGPYNRLVAPSWWYGGLVGALFFASAVAVAAAVSRAPRFDSENRAALLAVAGMTAFGIATLTYAVRFSTDDALLRSDLPAVMVVALWIHLAGRSGAGFPRPARTALAATGFWLAALLVVQGWNDLERKADRTPLVAALPGTGGSIREDISTTWGNPPIDAKAETAERLLDRYWPGQSRALVLLHPDLSVEALMRSDRVNLLPIVYFLTDDIVREQTRLRVLPAIDRIEPGTLMLIDRFYLTPGARRDYLKPNARALPLERLVIDRIRRRFRLEPVASETVSGSELLVVRLVPRGPATPGA
ncbi:MAG: hypothetical protein AABM29_04650 [Actinomycetota bacterium]